MGTWGCHHPSARVGLEPSGTMYPSLIYLINCPPSPHDSASCMHFPGIWLLLPPGILQTASAFASLVSPDFSQIAQICLLTHSPGNCRLQGAPRNTPRLGKVLESPPLCLSLAASSPDNLPAGHCSPFDSWPSLAWILDSHGGPAGSECPWHPAAPAYTPLTWVLIPLRAASLFHFIGSRGAEL